MNNIVQDFVELDDTGDLIDFSMPILINIDESNLRLVSVTEEEPEGNLIKGDFLVSQPVVDPSGNEAAGSKPASKKRKREQKTNKKQFEALIFFFNENADFPMFRKQ